MNAPTATHGPSTGAGEAGARVGDGADTGLDVVTGAFSYSGRAIADRLAAEGRRVRTITGHPARAPGSTAVEVAPLDFDDQLGLVDSLRGATTLYNTYWVRFARGRTDHDVAVANSRTLFRAAERAGVQRIVHVSITHPSIESPLPYFRGKALVERALAETGVSFAVLRPAILFGGDGVLLNNIAWLCVRRGGERHDSVSDAVGPERPSFLELVTWVRRAVDSHARIVRVPGRTVPLLSRLVGSVLHDVLLTADEYRAMEGGLADTEGPATGTTTLSGWLADHGPELGLAYANEIERHFDR